MASILAPKRYTGAMESEALEQIQTKIAYLERANAELSDVVFRQHQEIQALEARVRAISDRLQAAQAQERARSPDEERPPHY